MKYGLTMLCSIFTVALAFGQLYETSFNDNPQAAQFYQNYAPTLQKGPGDTLDLPFIDDFSYKGPVPSSAFWVDNSAYINQNFALQPPTVGVATLDGLRFDGKPYANGGTASADTLTSKPINLGGFSSSSNVNLSFFYQARGYGDKPGSQDSLFVEFKDNTGQWRTVYGVVDTTLIYQVPQFFFVSIAIPQNFYLYNGFQFRFRNIATLTGSRDHWHIDYVRLTAGQIPTTTLDDMAFANVPKSFLRNYTSMPWKHFEGFENQELALQNRMVIQNNFNATQNVRPAFFSLTELYSNTPSYNTEILDLGSNPLNGNIPTGYNVIDSVLVAAEASALQNSFSSFSNLDSAAFEVRYFMTPSAQQNNIPAVVRNDTASRIVYFKDEFAYDDNTAETAVAAGKLGDEFAIRYHANVGDSLRAIRIHLPRLTSANNQRINLKIWIDNLDNTPEWREDFVKAIYTDSLDGWTTYSLNDNPLYIPAGSDFYVGWQQATSPQTLIQSFLIGYDRNTPRGFNFVYQNVGGGWEKIDSVGTKPPAGAIMIRPVFGDKTPFTTATTPQQLVDFKVFPNPTSGILNISTSAAHFNTYQYRIVNHLGQTIQGDYLTPQLDVSGLQNGLYILVIQNKEGQIVGSRQFISLK